MPAVSIDVDSCDEVRSFLETRTFVVDISETYHGLLFKTEAPPSGQAFGRMARNRGWVVDYVAADSSLIHIVPMQEGDDA